MSHLPIKCGSAIAVTFDGQVDGQGQVLATKYNSKKSTLESGLPCTKGIALIGSELQEIQGVGGTSAD